MSQTHFMNKQNATDVFTAYANKIKAIISGHTIKDVDGVSLTQRSTLQFDGYLKSEDDSTNSMTVVDDSPTEIDYADYMALAPAQRDGVKWLIKNAPDNQEGKVVSLLTETQYNNLPTSEKENPTIIYYCY